MTVNDQLHTLEPESTITDLLEQLGITVRHVAVEVNGDLVPRERRPDFQLSNEDRVEVVTLVGGG